MGSSFGPRQQDHSGVIFLFFFVVAVAGLIVTSGKDPILDPARVRTLLEPLLADRGRLMAMARVARGLARPDALADITRTCLEAGGLEDRRG